jgi:hypothetical protein
VFDGYLDDPEGTEAVFVDGWCRTGDLGRVDEDGYLYITGRVKDLIHRGGEKISPLAIDAALRAIPGVRAAATFGIPHPTLGEEVIAAVVREGDVAIGESDILERVRGRVGPAAAPRRIHFVDALPVTDSGKMRRSALAQSYAGAQQRASDSRQPLTDTDGESSPTIERAVADLWSRVLGASNPQRDADFLVSGGDSLRATRLLDLVKEQFGVDLSIRWLFGTSATVAGMAREIEAARPDRRRDERTGRGGE